MDDQIAKVEERERVERLRALAAAGEWPALVDDLLSLPASSNQHIVRSLLRTALIKEGEEGANRIVAALTPEAMIALNLPLGEVRGFAEALMNARDLELVESLLSAAADAVPDDPTVAGLQIRLFGRQNRLGAIRRTMRSRPAAFHDPEAILYASEYVPLKSDEHDKLVDYFEDLPPDAGSALRLRGIRWLYRSGEEERAERIARRYHGNSEKSEFDGILNLLSNVPKRDARMRPHQEYPDILIGHSPGDRAALINFSGFGKEAKGDGRGSVLDRYIGDLGLTMIAVKDPNHLLCMNGIPGVADTVAESANILKQIVADLGLDTVYTMGGSAGGYPAAVYGLHLEARAAVLFGSPTDCSKGNSEIDFRAQVVARKLWRTFDAPTLDLIAWFDRFDYQLPITIYYSSENRIDAWHAKRIADRPHVNAIALDGEASHNAMIESVRGSTLGGVLSEALGLNSRSREERAPV